MSDTPPQTDPAPEYKAPPSSVAGVDAVIDEPTGDETGDDRPSFMARDRSFHVRPGVPALLLQKAAKKTSRLPKMANVDTVLTPAQRQDQMAALSANYDLLLTILVEEERNDFEDYVNDCDPVVEGEELGTILGAAIAAAAGRPTEPS